MNSRLTWADNAKALGMLLVFWGHFIEVGMAKYGLMSLHPFYKVIYSFHMPMFFLLAGYFFRPKDNVRFGSVLVQKAKTRVVPAIFFVYTAALFWAWDKPASWDMPKDIGGYEQLILLWQGKTCANWPCWFLMCLFLVELVSSELIHALKNKWVFLAFMPALYWFAYWVVDNQTIISLRIGIAEYWWYWPMGVMALFFYLCGYALSQYGRWLVPAARNRRAFLIFIACAIVVAVTYGRNFVGGPGVVNMSGPAYGDKDWFVITALAGTLMMISFCSLLPASRLLSLVGENTLPLLGINGFFLNFFNNGIWKAMMPMTANLPLLALASFAMSLVTLLVSLPIAVVLSRYLPFLVGKWK